MSGTLEVLGVGVKTLAERAEEVRREHALAGEAATSALRHALNAGDALLKAREEVERGSWEQWVEQNCALSPRQARAYMRLATYREVVESGDFRRPETALNYIRGLSRGRTLHTDETRAEIERLVRAGTPKREVARMTGISRSTIQEWLNGTTKRPAVARRRREEVRRRQQEARSAVVGRAARDAGGEVARAYSEIRRALQSLERAKAQADVEVRRVLAKAMTKLYAAEDEIGVALRAPIGPRRKGYDETLRGLPDEGEVRR